MINAVSNLGHHVSAVAGSYLHARSKNAMRVRTLVLGTALGTMFLVSTASIAEASSLSSYAGSVSGNTNVIRNIVSYGCYIGGTILSAIGIVDLKKHVENPSGTPLKNGLAKLGFGGILLALPFVSNVMQGTMAGTGEASFEIFTTAPTIS